MFDGTQLRGDSEAPLPSHHAHSLWGLYNDNLLLSLVMEKKKLYIGMGLL